MSVDRGELSLYEVVTEDCIYLVLAHQVTSPGNSILDNEEEQRLRFHGEFDGHWKLVFDIKTKYVERLSLIENDKCFPLPVSLKRKS